MSMVRAIFCTLAAGGLAIAQPAIASATRSSDALPSAGVAAAPQSVARGSQPAEAASELISPLWIALIIAFLGGIIAIAADGGSNNDSPG
ncbi:MAG: hypothetical protein WCY92_10860 [Novosphingobium sp.]|uniref:hypothetical protein n=1 Tax=Tsuneonella sp. CC-YZS046 TaxID=3042152 RepID=UPI002D78260D|nr:hypothetical protein [Tsuneonella sp. CC-YZS046]WRO66335.1 hypothetical protein U8326_15050 [Tsuneonella sp. CC-YZS046]